MTRFTTILSFLFVVSITISPTTASALSAPGFADDRLMTQAVDDACAGCKLGSLDRRLLTPEVAEYRFDLRVGPGEHDVIGIHRVVRELAPFVPSPTSRALFMAHGDIWDFDAAFLSSAATPAVPDAQALPVFLAENGVDVWGIDFRWTRVSADTTDLSFMADWGVETDARDLGIGLAVARGVRALTGQGFGKLHLLGWSRGGLISYAYLNAETLRPPWRRHVKGFIPADIYLKVDDPVLRETACLRYALTQARIDGGEFAEGAGQLFKTLGELASAAPDDTSPVLPDFTNLRAALVVGAATFLLAPDLVPVPHHHFTAGTFDQDGLPTGLVYTREELLFTFLEGASPWQPLQELADSDAAVCESPEVPDVRWDDYLGDITVPVLYLGAAGSFGASGIHTTTLLGSHDVTVHLVQMQPPELALLDFGHGDLFQADDAETLVWEPLLAWLMAH